MGAVYFVGVLATYFQARIMIGVSQRTLNKIREQLFKSLQKLPVRYFDQNPTGDIMSRFTNDVDIIGEMLNSTLVQIFSGRHACAYAVYKLGACACDNSIFTDCRACRSNYCR